MVVKARRNLRVDKWMVEDFHGYMILVRPLNFRSLFANFLLVRRSCKFQRYTMSTTQPAAASDPEVKKHQFYYFGLEGKGECIRLALNFAGIPFDDIIVVRTRYAVAFCVSDHLTLCYFCDDRLATLGRN